MAPSENLEMKAQYLLIHKIFLKSMWLFQEKTPFVTLAQVHSE